MCQNLYNVLNMIWYRKKNTNTTRLHKLPSLFEMVTCLLVIYTYVIFVRLLAQIIKFQAHFLEYPIKSIRINNAGEFSSKSFDAYCVSLGIEVEHLVPHVHTQNKMTKSFIKFIQVIAWTLMLRNKLNSSSRGHVVLHAATLIRLRLTSFHLCSLL